MARLAMTSLAFMLSEVPAPAWKTSTTNCSRQRPSTTSCAAWMMACPRRGSSSPRARLASAAARLTRAMARIISGCASRPLMGKFSTARAVCAP